MGRAVLFDLYGTLVDIKTCEEEASFWQELADWNAINLGRVISAEQLHRDYISLCEAKIEIYGEGSVLPAVFHELLGGSVSEEQVLTFAREFRKLSTRDLQIRSYTIPLLNRLRAEQFRLALVSNTEGILTNYDIDHLRLRSFFDAIVLSSEVGVAKPDPEILVKALQSISVTSRNAIFVGDTLETDASAARALDMPCVLIASYPETLMAYANCSVSVVRPVLQDINAEVKRLSSQSQ